MRALVPGTLLLPLALVACAGSSNDEETEPRPASVPNQLQQQRITFVSRRGRELEIFVMNADGSSQRQLTSGEDEDAFAVQDDFPALSPDGRRIAFTRTLPRKGEPLASTRELYVMNADGSKSRRLTRNRREEFGPDWLPDGRVIFLSCVLAKEPPGCDLVAIRPNGTRERQLADLGFTLDVAVSPDGRRIAYSQNAELFVADLNGANRRQLTDDDTGDASPAWSPDGSKLAFVSNRAESAPCFFHNCVGSTNELYVMGSDGDGVERLTETPHDEDNPTWSPDGSRIAYSRVRDRRGDYELFVVNEDGSCPTRVTKAWAIMPDWYGPASAASRPLDC